MGAIKSLQKRKHKFIKKLQINVFIIISNCPVEGNHEF